MPVVEEGCEFDRKAASKKGNAAEKTSEKSRVRQVESGEPVSVNGTV